MAMKPKHVATVGRRDFLRVLAAGAGAAATTAQFAGEAAGSESDQEKRKPRYRESEHVRAYYRVNRYPK
jgi:hypothetical protein